MTFLWILIPLAGIALAGFSEWLKFKRQTTQIGNSTDELEGLVSSLRSDIDTLHGERNALIQRVQNLEAIVTSEAWETLGTDRELAQAKAPPLQLPDLDAEDDAEQIAKMARRLRQ
jgi:hypothetical protein